MNLSKDKYQNEKVLVFTRSHEATSNSQNKIYKQIFGGVLEEEELLVESKKPEKKQRKQQRVQDQQKKSSKGDIAQSSGLYRSIFRSKIEQFKKRHNKSH